MWSLIEEGLIKLLLIIDSVIYGLVAKLFSLFVDLADSSGFIFSNDIIETVANRIYILFGVIALFIVTYSLIQSIVNPESFTKGNASGSKLAMNVVISVILIALVPSIFNFAYKLQNVILEDNIIGKILLGTSSSSISIVDDITGETLNTVSSSDIVKQQGYDLSWSVYNAFFHPADGSDGSKLSVEWSDRWGAYETKTDTYSFFACGTALVFTAGALIATIPSGGASATALPWTVNASLVACGVTMVGETIADIGYELTDDTLWWGEMEYDILLGDFSVIIPFHEKISSDEVTYMPIVATVAGIFLLYMIFSYCLDLGLRAVKLAFFQMIAPIPIMARILPNNKIFNNWLNITLATFLEVFIRMAVLFLVVFLASNISELSLFGNGTIGLLAKAIIILGIVSFARQAPKLISDITGIDSGNMKLGIMEKLGAGGALAAGALIGGGITAGVKNFTNSWRNTTGNRWQKLGAGMKSGIAGVASGGFRSARTAGFGAKSLADMKNAASTGAADAHSKSKARQSYKASHPGFGGVVTGHVKDSLTGVKEWAGIDAFADLKEEKTVTDEMKGFYSKMSEYVKEDPSVAMYNAQYDAALRNDEFFDSAAYQNAINSRINSYMQDSKYAGVSQDQLAIMASEEISRDNYIRKMTAAEKEASIKRAAALKKIATIKAINSRINAGDARFKAVANEIEAFKRKNARYDYVREMKNLSGTDWGAQTFTVNGRSYSFDEIINSGSDDAIEALAKHITGSSSEFGFASNQDAAKKAAGDVSVKLAKKIAEEQKKDK